MGIKRKNPGPTPNSTSKQKWQVLANQPGRLQEAAAEYCIQFPGTLMVEAYRKVRAYHQGTLAPTEVEKRQEKGRHVPFPKNRR